MPAFQKTYHGPVVCVVVCLLYVLWYVLWYVFEHIPPSESHQFITRITELLSNYGIYICGIPSLESQEYASEGSKIGHVNCLSKKDFKHQLKKHFRNVFIFGINDETLHTGFGQMCHYLLALCTNPIYQKKVLK